MSGQPAQTVVELLPAPDPGDPAAAAARLAIVRARLDGTPQPVAPAGLWWAAGLAEAIGDHAAGDGLGFASGRVGENAPSSPRERGNLAQVPPSRSSRGAARA